MTRLGLWKSLGLFIVGVPSIGIAQDQGIRLVPKPNEVIAAQNRVLEEDEGPPPANDAMQGRRMTAEEFEQWLYGNFGGSQTAFEQQYRSKAKKILNQIDQLGGISEAQMQKIEAAILLDVQRAERKISKLVGRYNEEKNANKQNELFTEGWQIVQALQRDSSTKDAFWRKVLNSQMTDEQRDRIDKDKKRRVEIQAESKRLKVMSLLQRRLGLTDSDRTKMAKFLEEKKLMTPEAALNKLRQLNKEELSQLLDAKQIESLEKNVPNEQMQFLDAFLGGQVMAEDPFGG